MKTQSAQLDQIFRSLKDPTRRAVLENLSRGPASVSTLAEPFGMALQSFSQHLKMLEDCGLIKSRKSGRIRTYELQPKALRPVETWLDAQKKLWTSRLDNLDALLANMKESDDD